MPRKTIKTIAFLLFIGLSSYGLADEKTVAFIQSSDNSYDNEIIQRIKKSASDLLAGQFTLRFQTYNGRNNIASIDSYIQQAFNNPDIDIIVATGLTASQALASKDSFPKPSIATIIINQRLQGLPTAPGKNSQKNNFTYLVSQYNVFEDLAFFHKVYPYQKIAFVFDQLIEQQVPLIKAHLTTLIKKEVPVILVTPENFSKKINTLSTHGIDAVYVGPLATFNQTQIQAFAQSLMQHKLPSFAMLGRNYVQEGILLGHGSSDSIAVSARRTAVNILKILNGENPSSLPINLPLLAKDPVFNMKTAHAINVFPNFSMQSQMDIINLLEESTNTINLPQAIQLALKNNLALQTAKQDLALRLNEKTLARSAFLPSIDVNARATKLDENSANSGLGAKTTTNYGAKLSQIVFSEQAFSLYKAQQHLIDAQLATLKKLESDIIFNVFSAYINILTAKRELAIQQENVSITKRSLDISQNKETLGYSGLTDVYRLESELYSNKSTAVAALANVRRARLTLLNLLNIPLNGTTNVQDIEDPLALVITSNQKIFSHINNTKKLNTFINYLVELSEKDRADLVSINSSIDAQQRLLASEKRKQYFPLITLTAESNKLDNTRDELRAIPSQAFESTWNVNLNASLPLYNNRQSANVKKILIELERLKLQKNTLENDIELNIRANMQTAISSFQQMGLAQQASESAVKSYAITEENYRQGTVNVTTLLDVQNNALISKINAVNAQQKFILDFLRVENDVGFYYFLSDEQQINQFFEALERFLEKR